MFEIDSWSRRENTRSRMRTNPNQRSLTMTRKFYSLLQINHHTQDTSDCVVRSGTSLTCIFTHFIHLE